MAMLALPSMALGFAPTTALAPSMTARAASPVMETIADLEALAPKLNPKVGFYDPLGLSKADLWGSGEQASIGFLRHSEIKHGRIAMFAFVGYCVQAQGVHWPWNLNVAGLPFADISAAGSPPEQWDALPTIAKIQIFGAISFLELCGERSDLLEAQGGKHYMMGGKPGVYPSIKDAGVPHPVPLDLYDPFGLSKNASPEKKEKGLIAEINNGRLAMLGIMGFIAEAKIPGSVPFLTGVIPPYAGEPMAPFSAMDSAWPFVSQMLTWKTSFVS